MSFRKAHDDAYNDWRLKNLPRLTRLGIPERIAKDNRQFWLLVQEGEEIGGYGWNVGWVAEGDGSELFELLIGFLPCDAGWDLVDQLRNKLGEC